MSNRTLAAGVFRAWGVMWMISAILAIPQLLNVLSGYPSSGGDRAMQIYSLRSHVIGTLCALAAALFLILKSSWLAERVFPTEEHLQLSFGPVEFQAILFSALGLYFALDGVRGLAVSGYFVFAKPPGDTRSGFEYLWDGQRQDLVRSAAALIFGILVFFGSRGLGGLWRRYQMAGRPDSAEAPENE